MNLTGFGTGRKSSESWRRMWLDKLSESMIKTRLPQSRRLLYRDTVDRYLNENPGNPRRIEITRLRHFLETQQDDPSAALLFFYTNICASEEHLEMLGFHQEKLRLLAAMEKKMRAQKYTSRAITDYSALAAAYLGRLGCMPSADDASTIRAYLAGLKEKEGLSPGAVKRHATAISFLYSYILGFAETVKTIPGTKSR